MAEYKTKKNGLIELFRFLCSIWVAYFHGFSPILSDKFNGVILPVDFFFLVSGFFFLKSIQKYRDGSVWKGIGFVFWSRTNRFIVPLIIAASSVLLCNIIFPIDLCFNWPLSFLWFFAAQFVYLSCYFLLLKVIKKQFIFNIICGVVICISLSMFLLGIKNFDICFRGPAMLAIGMLLSQIPKLKFKLKDEKKSNRLSVAINAIGFSVASVLAIYLIYLPDYAIWKIHLICCILFPAIVYFGTSVPVRGRFFDFLGEFSVFIYLAQCPILLHYYAFTHDTKLEFYTLCVCALALFAINRFVNYLRKRRNALKAQAA